MNAEMTEQQLESILKGLHDIGVEPYLDGGWGVDALLRKQTRKHKDVDLVIFKDDLDKAMDYFRENGFKESIEDGVWWHFFMESPEAVIDFLVLTKADDGGAYLGPVENNAYFPPEAFSGEGTVGSQNTKAIGAAYRVRSLTKEFGVVVRNQYQITESDCRDMIALCRAFDIDIPVDYTEFMDENDLSY